MGIQINGQTDTVTSTTAGGKVTVTPASFPSVDNLNATGIVTASSFRGNINSTGVSTITTLNATSLVGVNTVGVVTVYASGSLQSNSIVPVGGIPAGASGGGIIQVVSQNFTSKVSTSGNGWTTLTGLSTSITPRSTSSKILVMVKIGLISSNIGDYSGAFRIQRNGTTILQGADTGNSRDRAAFRGIAGANSDHGIAVGMNGIDSPASTSSLSYTVDCNPQDGSIFCINQEYNSNNNGDSYSMNVMSNITLMEICN